MSDSNTTIKDVKDKIEEFCEERDWDQFHSPTQLAIGVNTEAAELLQIFRFKNDKEAKELMETKRTEIGEELADVFFFVLRFAQMNDIDLSDCLSDKLEKNNRKYPVEKAKGRNLKYNEY